MKVNQFQSFHSGLKMLLTVPNPPVLPALSHFDDTIDPFDGAKSRVSALNAFRQQPAFLWLHNHLGACFQRGSAYPVPLEIRGRIRRCYSATIVSVAGADIPTVLMPHRPARTLRDRGEGCYTRVQLRMHGYKLGGSVRKLQAKPQCPQTICKSLPVKLILLRLLTN